MGRAYPIWGLFASGITMRRSNSTRSGSSSLFSGKDLAGWSAWDERGPLGQAEASKIWSVRDGVLIGSGRRSHLFSPRGDYKNFHVKAEVQINATGNSGLYFRAPISPRIPAGYEAQIICTRNESRNIGTLYGANAPAPAVPSSLPRPDTWFTVEAEAVGNRIQVWINGQKTIDWTDPQNSYSSGHFAIQVIDDQTRIQVRKLEVRELLPADLTEPKSANSIDSPKPPAPATVGSPLLPASIKNSVGMTLKLIPAGEFVMGSADDDKDAEHNEKPMHRVRITRPFYLGMHEVTQAQYRAVSGSTRAVFRRSERTLRLSWATPPKPVRLSACPGLTRWIFAMS